MSVELTTPFTMVNRRSAPMNSADILTGRWVTLDGSGIVVSPGTVRKGLYLVLEGKLGHKGGPTDFGGSTPFASTKSFEFPSAKAADAAGLAYGVFRYKVGPEGCVPSSTEAALFAAGSLVTIDNDGRVVATGATAANAIGKAEAVSVDGGGLVTEVHVRTFGS